MSLTAQQRQPTAQEQRVLDFVLRYIDANGYSPSTRDIQRAFGFRSQTSAVRAVRGLEAKGLIVRGARGSARAITPAKRSDSEDLAARLRALAKSATVGDAVAKTMLEAADRLSWIFTRQTA